MSSIFPNINPPLNNLTAGIFPPRRASGGGNPNLTTRGKPLIQSRVALSTPASTNRGNVAPVTAPPPPMPGSNNQYFESWGGGMDGSIANLGEGWGATTNGIDPNFGGASTNYFGDNSYNGAGFAGLGTQTQKGILGGIFGDGATTYNGAATGAPGGIFSSALQQKDGSGGWLGAGAGVLKGVFDGWMAMKDFGLRENAQRSQEEQFNKNFGAQQRLTNMQIAQQNDKRLLQSPGKQGQMSTEAYLAKYGV